MEMRIAKRVVLGYKLVVETGIHVGGNKETYGIGGVDSPVIKNPFTDEPIIPGSSIKGKIRMLLETVDSSEYSYKDNKDAIKKAFGTGADDKNQSLTRIVFRDLVLTEESAKELESKLGKGFFTEIKAENSIDKLTAKANPRFIERVPAGAVFTGECVIQVLENETTDYVKLLKDGFKLLENSYLGGSGSRGYGKVKVEYVDEKVI